MHINQEFCRPIDEGTRIEFAPVMLPPNPHAPTEAEYNAAGWYRKAIEPPAPPEGQQVASVMYVVSGNKVVAQYTYEDAPPPVRTFSKMRIEEALFKRGLLSAFDSFLNSKTIPNAKYPSESMPLHRKYDAANVLCDNHPTWEEFFDDAKTELGLDDETIAEILAEAEVGA